LKLSVNLIESTTEIVEFTASFIGDEKLSHPFPIDVPSGFEGYIRHFFGCSAHFRFLFSNAIMILDIAYAL
jgi:hypothetical protein